MEIKAILLKPYTKQGKINFIIEQGDRYGYMIKETKEELQAWGYTEEEQQEQEKERIAKLSLTKREVFLALYNAKGITPDMVRANITNTPALIEFDYATEYFRFNPLIDSIGATLGYSSADLDYLFVNKELPNKEGI